MSEATGWGLVALATAVSMVAGMGTAVGALLMALVPRLSPRLEDALLSFAAGIMLAASFVSLLLPGMADGTELLGSAAWGSLLALGGMALGALGLGWVHHRVPHEHFHQGHEGPVAARVPKLWLFVFAITLHNLPEGMAVGVGFAANPDAVGLSLALGIWLQNIPEGLAVACALVALGYRRTLAMLIAIGTGLVEPLGGFFGAAGAWLAAPALPVMLGMAAGCMVYIISDEIVPETHARGHSTLATGTLLGGIALMLWLNNALA